jgi:hypothetical protein
MSEAKLERLELAEHVTVLTVYAKKEAKSYLMRDWEKYGDKARVIKHVKYERPPVVKMGDFAQEVKE